MLVRGLAEGDYALSIDGQPIRSFSSAALATGINLARATNTPQMRQSVAVLDALRKKWDATAQLRTLAYGEHFAWPDATHPVDAAQMPAKLEARLARVGTSNPWIVAQAKQYLEVKPREADLRTEAQLAAEHARRLSQPRPHHFSLRRLAPSEAR